jgi:hypothetical protein
MFDRDDEGVHPLELLRLEVGAMHRMFEAMFHVENEFSG